MSSFLFAVKAVLPIILLASLGYVLKRTKLLSQDFLSVAYKLCYKVCLPVMLFLNVYTIESVEFLNWTFVLFCVVGLCLCFLFALVITKLFVRQDNQKGAMIQCVVRTNYAILGIPLAGALFGAQGTLTASVLAIFVLPLVNVFSVIGLSIYNKNPNVSHSPLKMTVDIINNPPIIGLLAAGIAILVRYLFTLWGIDFRLSQLTAVMKTLNYISAITTPLALIVLGGQFEFSSVATYIKQISLGVILRLVVVPLLAIAAAYLFFDFNGGEYATLIALFGGPVAATSAIVVSQFEGDEVFAGQLVVWTTLLCCVTVFIFAVTLRSVGIF